MRRSRQREGRRRRRNRLSALFRRQISSSEGEGFSGANDRGAAHDRRAGARAQELRVEGNGAGGDEIADVACQREDHGGVGLGREGLAGNDAAGPCKAGSEGHPGGGRFFGNLADLEGQIKDPRGEMIGEGGLGVGWGHGRKGRAGSFVWKVANPPAQGEQGG